MFATSIRKLEILLLKTLQEMSPKWAEKAYFGDISYNVFDTTKTQYYMLETLYFTIFSRMDNLNENNQQKCIIVEIIYKNLFAIFWCYGI